MENKSACHGCSSKSTEWLSECSSVHVKAVFIQNEFAIIANASALVITSCGRAFVFAREIIPLSAASSTARHIQPLLLTSVKYPLH